MENDRKYSARLFETTYFKGTVSPEKYHISLGIINGGNENKNLKQDGRLLSLDLIVRVQVRVHTVSPH